MSAEFFNKQATGVTVLLLLAELLSSYSGKRTVELVAMNSEDYFSNPGEQQYLAANAGKFDDIVLGVNIDGAGYHKGRTAYSSITIRRKLLNRADLWKDNPGIRAIMGFS